jgi:hypothetical protein
MLLESLNAFLVARVIISLYTVANQARKLEWVDKTLAFTSLLYGSCFIMRLL